MKLQYANALEILPPEVFNVIQKHFTGLLYIPNQQRFYKERRNLVMSLSKKGVGSAEIARLAGISRRRVNQIIKDFKKNDTVTDKK